VATYVESPVKPGAWVGQGIAPLVAALNGFKHVETLDSCEDDYDYGAYVSFRYRGDGREAAAFVAGLAGWLTPQEDDADYLLSAEWRPDTDEPILRLACPTAHIDRLAAVLNGVVGPGRGISGSRLRS
jgi:hypothetical protein